MCTYPIIYIMKPIQNSSSNYVYFYVMLPYCLCVLLVCVCESFPFGVMIEEILIFKWRPFAFILMNTCWAVYCVTLLLFDFYFYFVFVKHRFYVYFVFVKHHLFYMFCNYDLDHARAQVPYQHSFLRRIEYIQRSCYAVIKIK